MNEAYDLKHNTVNLIFEKKVGDPKINTLILIKGGLKGMID